MQPLRIYIPIIVTGSLLISCAGHTARPGPNADKNTALLIDTGKLKADEANIMEAISGSSRPDTNKLKAAASDILSADAAILSDSGISTLGDKNDPAARSAQNTLIKMRNAMGITPASLDSMRKAAGALGKGTNH